jgi:hypothetical protein
MSKILGAINKIKHCINERRVIWTVGQPEKNSIQKGSQYLYLPDQRGGNDEPVQREGFYLSDQHFIVIQNSMLLTVCILLKIISQKMWYSSTRNQ